MNQAICIVAKAPVRAKPSDKAEMVTELLFGEELVILEQQEKWSAIKCNWDGYQGWVDNKQIEALTEAIGAKKILRSPITTIQSNYGSLRLPMGAELFDGKFNFEKVDQENFTTISNSRASLIACGLEFLNVPYLWGGRSIFGIDCSGLTQICYKLCGIKIPRDASQQAKEGEEISFVENALPGDLAFFENKEGKIIHVGIMLADQKILHASGHVRIDLLDHQGIFNQEIGDYTHQLRWIKRFDLVN